MGAPGPSLPMAAMRAMRREAATSMARVIMGSRGPAKLMLMTRAPSRIDQSMAFRMWKLVPEAPVLWPGAKARAA